MKIVNTERAHNIKNQFGMNSLKWIKKILRHWIIFVHEKFHIHTPSASYPFFPVISKDPGAGNKVAECSCI
jgi:hypothetical protein